MAIETDPVRNTKKSSVALEKTERVVLASGNTKTEDLVGSIDLLLINILSV